MILKYWTLFCRTGKKHKVVVSWVSSTFINCSFVVICIRGFNLRSVLWPALSLQSWNLTCPLKIFFHHIDLGFLVHARNTPNTRKHRSGDGWMWYLVGKKTMLEWIIHLVCIHYSLYVPACGFRWGIHRRANVISVGCQVSAEFPSWLRHKHARPELSQISAGTGKGRCFFFFFSAVV